MTILYNVASFKSMRTPKVNRYISFQDESRDSSRISLIRTFQLFQINLCINIFIG